MAKHEIIEIDTARVNKQVFYIWCLWQTGAITRG
jgi:hypothetical protein